MRLVNIEMLVNKPTSFNLHRRYLFNSLFCERILMMIIMVLVADEMIMVMSEYFCPSVGV